MEKILFQARGSWLCAPLNPDRGKIYVQLQNQGKIWIFFSLLIWNSPQLRVPCSTHKYTMTFTLKCTCQSHSKLGPPCKSVYFLFPLKWDFCDLLTNLGLRKCVFSLWLFCPSLNVLLLKAVFSQATSVPDKATSYYYLTRKALQTLKIDKTENEKLSTCLFPVIISGFKPINILLQLSQKGTT